MFEGGPLFAASTATQVTVIDKADDTLANLWSDRDGLSVKGNPFFITVAGKIEMYLNPGRYRVTASKAGQTDTWEDVLIIDPEAGGGGGDRLTVTALSIVSGVVTVDVSLGVLFTLDMTENVTSWVFSGTPGAGKGGAIAIEVTQGNPARTLALPSGGDWTAGSQTSLSVTDNKKHLLCFTSHDNFTSVIATMQPTL